MSKIAKNRVFSRFLAPVYKNGLRGDFCPPTQKTQKMAKKMSKKKGSKKWSKNGQKTGSPYQRLIKCEKKPLARRK
jgi:hypothetical protein